MQHSTTMWRVSPLPFVAVVFLVPAIASAQVTEIIDPGGDGSGNTLRTPLSVAVDGSRNVYVGGYDSDNVFIITPGGGITELIDVTGDGSGNPLSGCFAVAVDGLEQVYVTGANSNNAFKVIPCGLTASATFRSAGANAANYSADPPILGATLTGTVDLGGTTGHDFALLVGFTTPLDFTLDGGQVLLVNTLDLGGEQLGQSMLSGPLAVFTVPVPCDVSYCGVSISTQAVHFGGVTPFVLSNAQDLVLGF